MKNLSLTKQFYIFDLNFLMNLINLVNLFVLDINITAQNEKENDFNYILFIANEQKIYI